MTSIVNFLATSIKSSAPKQLTAHGLSVDVVHVVRKQENHLYVVEIQAVCGQSVEGHNMTVGAVDGKRLVPPTADELQKMVDDTKQEVATHAAWKESVRLGLEKLT